MSSAARRALSTGIRTPLEPGRRRRSRRQGRVPADLVPRGARAVTARSACASMDSVMCRYQARYWRTW
jgi:hypothetical protein